VVVAWNMAEKREFALLIRSSRGDAVVLLATFLLTIFRDLTEGSSSALRLVRCCSSTAWPR
jgi:SulP family sulfate permease